MLFIKPLRVVFVFGLLIFGLSQPNPIHAQEAYGSTAHRADDFVDSICVATHWSYTDTPYGYSYEQTRQKLVESGIRNIRDGLYKTRFEELGAVGIRGTILVDSPNNKDGSIQDIRTQLQAIKTANAAGALIDAVEGPNEPDLFWKPENFDKTYNGKRFPEGALEFQRDLYTEVKNDPALRHLKVIGVSLGVTYWGSDNPFPDNSLENFVDWGNFHPYPGGNAFNYPFDYNTIQKYYWNSNFPSIALDEHPINFTTYRPPYGLKPMAATETGYSTFKNGPSEKVHAKYIPRLYMEYFRLGIKRTCTYEFIDEFNNPDKSNREAHFGLVRRDLTPKPAYYAVQNLINLLKDPGTPFAPGELPYTVKVNPPEGYNRTNFVHHQLFQKRDGTFYLAIWHEISNNDTSVNPPREITPPDMPTVITFGGDVQEVTLYRLEDTGSMTTSILSVQNQSISLDVPDRVVVLGIKPAPALTVFNGGFENAGSTNKLAASWNTRSTEGSKRICNKPDKNKFFSRTGDCAYQFKGKSGIRSSVSRKLETWRGSTGDTLTFSAWVRMDKPATGAKFLVKIKYSDGQKGKMKVPLEARTGDYESVSSNLILTGAVAEVEILMKMKGASGKFLVDDIGLTQTYP